RHPRQAEGRGGHGPGAHRVDPLRVRPPGREGQRARHGLGRDRPRHLGLVQRALVVGHPRGTGPQPRRHEGVDVGRAAPEHQHGGAPARAVQLGRPLGPHPRDPPYGWFQIQVEEGG
ncbi:MAG: hypothetical protein ACK559_39245, partial [bacterium]